MAIVFAILAAVLILLKLVGVISLSWGWIAVIGFVPFIFFLFIVGSILGFAGMAVGISSLLERKHKR